jgi:APA family basic amino acid/polyamine antiporter
MWRTANEKSEIKQLSGGVGASYGTPSLPQAYTWGALWRTFPIKKNDDAEQGGNLAKVLKVWDLTAYGIGSTVGAGIFVVTGVVARDKAGPAIVLSFLYAAFASLMSAFCYAEFAARIPVSGSAYTFAYVTVGEILGWLIGWNLTLEYALSASAVARGWSGYVYDFFKIVGVTIPDWLSGHPLVSYFSISFLAAGIVVAMSLLLLFGVKNSSRFNLAITILNVVIILFVIILGATEVDTNNWDPFFPYGFEGSFQGAGTVFFSFIGFDSVTTLAGEVANPGRDLPIGIGGTLGIATALYVGVSLIITGMVSYKNVNVNSPLSRAFQDKGMTWAAGIIAAGSVSTLTSTTFASLLGQPRIFYQMAVDGLLPPLFKKLNSRQVPVYGTLITGLVAGTIAFLFDLNDLADMISIGTLMAFTIVCSSVLVLRYRSPEHPVRIAAVVLAFACACLAFSFTWQFSTPWYAKVITGSPVLIIFGYLLGQQTTNLPTTFVCPLVPLIPSVGVLVNIYLITSLPIEAFYRVLVWTAIGLAIYFGYGIRNSALRFQLAAASAGFSEPDHQVVVPGHVVVGDIKTKRFEDDDGAVSSTTTEYRFSAEGYSINSDGTPSAALIDDHSKFN